MQSPYHYVGKHTTPRYPLLSYTADLENYRAHHDSEFSRDINHLHGTSACSTCEV
jgi:hypothetical protein